MTVLIDSRSWIEYWKRGRHSDRAAAHIEGTETTLASRINPAEIYHSVLRDYDERTAITYVIVSPSSVDPRDAG